MYKGAGWDGSRHQLRAWRGPLSCPHSAGAAVSPAPHWPGAGQGGFLCRVNLEGLQCAPVSASFGFAQTRVMAAWPAHVYALLSIQLCQVSEERHLWLMCAAAQPRRARGLCGSDQGKCCAAAVRGCCRPVQERGLHLWRVAALSACWACW